MTAQNLLDELIAKPAFSGAVLAASWPGEAARLWAAGDIAPDRPYFAASATKLYVTTMVLQAVEEGRLALDMPFAELLQGPEVARLLVIGGADLTPRITLRHLLTHTSGLPDYFDGFGKGTGLFADLMAGRDRSWSFAEAMEMTRCLPPKGVPGVGRRAEYSDSNFQLLGAVMAAVDGVSFAESLLRRILRPLGLHDTWLFSDPADRRPVPLRVKGAPLEIPRAMESFGADGALVCTAGDADRFLRALAEGRFFPPGRLTEGPFRPMQFPLRYGLGVMRFHIPRAFTLFRPTPPLIGHSGLSGAFAFFDPETGLALSGSTNAISEPSAPFRLMLRALMALRAERLRG